MCGRYTVISKLKIIEKEFRTDTSEIINRYQQNINVSPGEQSVVIVDDVGRTAKLMAFGMTPFWAKKRMYVFNARSEGDSNKDNSPNYLGAAGILTKPMFRKPIRSQRCLVIADAFIEGPTKEKLSKPYLVYRKQKQRPFAMAGIWDVWNNSISGEEYFSFSVLTTAATPLMQTIGHHRSPLILEEHEEDIWLDSEVALSDITQLLYVHDSAEYNAYPISPQIKSPRATAPEILKPLGPPVKSEYEYTLYEELELQGMGETTARKRRKGEQGTLFDF